MKISTKHPTKVDGQDSPVLFSPVPFFDQENGGKSELDAERSMNNLVDLLRDF